MPVTRFPARTSGPAERLAGFTAHLRLNGLRLGPRETAGALEALSLVDATDPGQARLAMATALTGNRHDWQRFDDLFDAYWQNAGRAQPQSAPEDRPRLQSVRPGIWDRADQAISGDTGAEDDHAISDDGEGDAAGEGTGKLLASAADPQAERNLAAFDDPAQLAAAEEAAERLARVLRDRRSRRYRHARRGRRLDLRRALRLSLARGGEPLHLPAKRHRLRPLRLLTLLDVSGSMERHARVFLAFLRGLVSADLRAEAFLFHTRLARVSDVLADPDRIRASDRLALMCQGFGGGTRIASALRQLNDQYRGLLSRRTVVLILSDGYDSDPVSEMAEELARIRGRARGLVWLNPLPNWREHAETARGMQAALPHVDLHLPANSLASLAALDTAFERL